MGTYLHPQEMLVIPHLSKSPGILSLTIFMNKVFICVY